MDFCEQRLTFHYQKEKLFFQIGHFALRYPNQFLKKNVHERKALKYIYDSICSLL